MDETSKLDYERLADLVVRKIEKKVMRMPDEFRDNVRKQYYVSPVTIPMTRFADDYFLVEIYVTDVGGMILRIKDSSGGMIAEKLFA